jgi:molybdopterin molybdotransferase
MTRLLSVDEALQRVLAHTTPLPPRSLPLAEALGCVLAEDVSSDIDSPPHDKSVVDGYAIRSADLASGQAELVVVDELTAGMVPRRAVAPGQAVRIMTGAPIPEGADAVVMVEKTQGGSGLGSRVSIRSGPVRPGQNIMRRAASLAKGQQVLAAGRRLRAIECGLLAEVGRAQVAVRPRPRVAVLATGNELVPHTAVPGPGQIRNSNGPLLEALIREAGAEVGLATLAADDHAALTQAIQRGLTHDVLLITGGVSAGVLDLVPATLAASNVREVFHKVNIKPGKPLWFGVGQSPDTGGRSLVFGLPGNPVSTLVSFLLFVKPALARLAGQPDCGLAQRCGRLTEPFQQHGDRPTYWPVALSGFAPSQGRGTEAAPALEVTPLRWKGSGDLATLTDAQGLAVFPAGECEFLAGSLVQVLAFSTADESRPPEKGVPASATP